MSLAEEFIKEKGLTAQFNEWKKQRKSAKPAETQFTLLGDAIDVFAATDGKCYALDRPVYGVRAVRYAHNFFWIDGGSYFWPIDLDEQHAKLYEIPEEEYTAYLTAKAEPKTKKSKSPKKGKKND